MSSGETGHTNTTEGARIIEATALVLTRMRFAFVNVGLATWPSKTLRTIAHKRTGRIDTDTIMLAGRSLIAFVDVLRTINTFITGGTRTSIGAINRTCITDGIGMARIRGAGIIQVTEKTRFTGCTAAIERTDAIYASGTIQTGCCGTVVDILTAIRAIPTIDTDARIGTR